jgi:hypothetical protein
MPRRAKKKCPPRGSGPKLNVIVEWETCMWQGLGPEGLGYGSFKDLANAWDTHKETILPECIRQLPGSRPFAQYALGEVPLPEMVQRPYQNDCAYRGKIGPVYEYQCYFEDQESEFEHLQKIGIVTGDEVKKAKERFRKSERDCYNFITKPVGVTSPKA